MIFYLSRDTKIRGGGYSLTTYLPKAPPNGESLINWWFLGSSDTDITLTLSDRDAQKIEARIGRSLEMGETVNLATGEALKIENAAKLELV